MIDFHTHILPNIDDGSGSIEETFNLIEEARNAGFRAIISTSHYMEEYYEVSKNKRKEIIDAISQGLRQKNIDIELFLGNEIYLSENTVNLIKNENISTQNGSKYALFEVSLNAEPFDLYDNIYALQEYNLVPILAHPERYGFIQDDPDMVYDLIQRGVLMQCNYGSIIGQYGKKAKIIVTKLLENNMVHFLGSDVHKENTIYPRIGECLSKIKAIVGDETTERLCELNPYLVLENRDIEVLEPTKIKLSFSERRILSK